MVEFDDPSRVAYTVKPTYGARLGCAGLEHALSTQSGAPDVAQLTTLHVLRAQQSCVQADRDVVFPCPTLGQSEPVAAASVAMSWKAFGGIAGARVALQVGPLHPSVHSGESPRSIDSPFGSSSIVRKSHVAKNALPGLVEIAKSREISPFAIVIPVRFPTLHGVAVTGEGDRLSNQSLEGAAAVTATSKLSSGTKAMSRV